VIGRSSRAELSEDVAEAKPARRVRSRTHDAPCAPLELGHGGGAKDRVVIISAYHDYRTPKRASLHQIADALVHAGFAVSFISTRYSLLSRLTGDSRLFLWGRANTVELANGVECLLWRTAAHPFRSRMGLVQLLSGYAYDLYSELPNPLFDELLRKADYVVVESGIAAIYLARIRRMNARAKIIYYAADRLETIGAHPSARRKLSENEAVIDHFCLRATQLKDDFPYAAGRMYKAGFGINPEEFAGVGPSPYASDEKVVISVGSMLFDPFVVQTAAANFPQLQFHVIGPGVEFDAPPNVHIHPEMPFDRTLAFVKHASIGLAPYAPVEGGDYLAESSLKLMQFEYFGLPSVCPRFAAGSSPSRFAYEPGDEASIRSAITAALGKVGRVEGRVFPSWEEIALQVIEPIHHGADRIG
jgi:2-beta-glucuronyltransferase